MPPAAPVTMATRCCSLILFSLGFGPRRCVMGRVDARRFHPLLRRPMLLGQFEKDQTPTTALIAQITAVEAYSPRAAQIHGTLGGSHCGCPAGNQRWF